MDVERALVSRIARTQSMGPVAARVLEPHHFLQRRKGDASPEPLPGEVFAWMVDQQRRYRMVPSFELARQRFPGFEFIDSSDSLEALMDKMVRVVKRRLLIDSLRQLSEIADDPARVGEAETHVFEVASELSRAVPSSAITRYSDSLNRLELYKQREATGQTPGVSLAIPQLDALTYGIQSHELAIIEGFLGQKKSSLAVMMSAIAYFTRDQTPLFCSFEMEGEKLAQRWDSYAAQFSYSAMKRLELGDEDKQRWEEIGERASNSKFDKDILVIDDVRRPTSDFVYTQIERWRPDFTIVDTLDEVRAPSHMRAHWEQQDHVARELKGIARATKRPLVAIAQAGRDAATEGATLGNIAGSITIARKADIAIGLHATEEMKKAHQTEVRMLKNRDDAGEGQVFTLYWDVGKMEMRDWTPGDAIPTKEGPLPTPPRTAFV